MLAAARGAFPGPAPACSRSSRTATPARATASRISSRCWARPTRCCCAEVYAAGEAPIVAADGRALARALRVAGKVDPLFVDEIDAMAEAIVEQARDGDVVIVMGAGSIGAVAGQVARKDEVVSDVDVKALGKVAVLMGGSSPSARSRLLSGSGVLEALQSQGVDAQAFDPAERDLVELKRDGFARCFIALHGRHGEDGTVQGALELLRHPVHRLRRDGLGDRDGQGHDQARLDRRGPADAALRDRCRAKPRAASACAPCPTNWACR